MKRFIRLIIASFVLAGLAVTAIACGAEPVKIEAVQTRTVTVERGDLAVEITAAGNLALSRTEDLAFDIAGTVEEVLVEEGDSVEEGQVLARLDEEEWEDNLETLRDKLTTAERALTAKKQQLAIKERNVAAKERAVLQSEISLKNAETALATAQDSYTWPELEVAKAEVEQLEAYLQYALDGQAEYGTDSWSRLVTRVQAQLDAAQKNLDAMLTGADPEEVEIKRVQVEIAEGNLEETRATVVDAENEVADARLDIKEAEKALLNAQEELESANSKSPLITAPFDGFITRVNVDGGDEVMTGTVAVQIADPNQFKAEIMVSEMDIMQVKLDGEARVSVDSMSGMSLSARVTHISPTATIQSGVVNYVVKVEVESLETVAQERQAARQETVQSIQQGEIPDRLKQAIEEGSITQEQVQAMIQQRQQGLGGQQMQMSAAMPDNFQLREGLTVTVSIIVAQSTDVVLVPNAAITVEGRRSYVQVVTASGDTEKRAIETGIADWQYTEVTDGLSEGEQVLAPQGTATSTAATQQQQGGMFIPGMGGGLR